MQVIIGIELECALPSVPYCIAEYHKGEWGENEWWKAESDSSLSTDYEDEEYECVELISTKLGSVEEIKMAFGELRDKGITKMDLNPSMGAHTNLSVRGLPLRFIFSPVLQQRLRDVFSRLGTEAQKRRYFRNYAQNTDFHNFYTHRESEFNLRHSNRIEWRSVNLCGLSDVGEVENFFIRLYSKICEVLENYEFEEKLERELETQRIIERENYIMRDNERKRGVRNRNITVTKKQIQKEEVVICVT